MIDVKNLPHLSGDDVERLLKEQGFAIGVMHPDEYHETKKRFPISLSKSSITKAIDSLYRYRHAAPVETSKAMAFGSLVDTMLLTPELFDAQYVRVDKKPDGRTKEGKALLAEIKAQGKQPFCEAEARTELMAVKHAQELLDHEIGDEYTPQVAMWVMTPASGSYGVEMVISGMVDMLPHNPEEEGIWDLKTTSVKVGNMALLCKHMSDFYYGIQAAMYIDLFRECGGECKEQFSFLFVESSLPCCTRVVTMVAEDIDRYRSVYLGLLAEIAEAHRLDSWGSHIHEPEVYTAPRWEEADLERKGFQL